MQFTQRIRLPVLKIAGNSRDDQPPPNYREGELVQTCHACLHSRREGAYCVRYHTPVSPTATCDAFQPRKSNAFSFMKAPPSSGEVKMSSDRLVVSRSLAQLIHSDRTVAALTKSADGSMPSSSPILNSSSQANPMANIAPPQQQQLTPPGPPPQNPPQTQGQQPPQGQQQQQPPPQQPGAWQPSSIMSLITTAGSPQAEWARGIDKLMVPQAPAPTQPQQIASGAQMQTNQQMNSKQGSFIDRMVEKMAELPPQQPRNFNDQEQADDSNYPRQQSGPNLMQRVGQQFTGKINDFFSGQPQQQPQQSGQPNLMSQMGQGIRQGTDFASSMVNKMVQSQPQSQPNTASQDPQPIPGWQRMLYPTGIYRPSETPGGAAQPSMMARMFGAKTPPQQQSQPQQGSVTPGFAANSIAGSTAHAGQQPQPAQPGSNAFAKGIHQPDQLGPNDRGAAKGSGTPQQQAPQQPQTQQTPSGGQPMPSPIQRVMPPMPQPMQQPMQLPQLYQGYGQQGQQQPMRQPQSRRPGRPQTPMPTPEEKQRRDQEHADKTRAFWAQHPELAGRSQSLASANKNFPVPTPTPQPQQQQQQQPQAPTPQQQQPAPALKQQQQPPPTRRSPSGIDQAEAAMNQRFGPQPKQMGAGGFGDRNPQPASSGVGGGHYSGSPAMNNGPLPPRAPSGVDSAQSAIDRRGSPQQPATAQQPGGATPGLQQKSPVASATGQQNKSQVQPLQPAAQKYKLPSLTPPGAQQSQQAKAPPTPSLNGSSLPGGKT